MARKNIALLSTEAVVCIHSTDELCEQVESHLDSAQCSAQAQEVIDAGSADVEMLESLKGSSMDDRATGVVLQNVMTRSGIVSAGRVSTESLSTVGSIGLEDLKSDLSRKLCLAQEGAMKDWWDRVTEYGQTADALDGRLNQLHGSFRPVAEGTVLTGTRWIKRLIGREKQLVAKDAMKKLEYIIKLMDDPKLAHSLDEVIDYVQSVTKEIRDPWFIAGAENIENIRAAKTQIAAVLDQIHHYSGELALHGNKARTSEVLTALSLSKTEETKLYNETHTLLQNTKLDKIFEDFKGTQNWAVFWWWWNSRWRLTAWLTGGIFAGFGVFAMPASVVLTGVIHSDLRAGYQALSAAGDCARIIEQVITFRNAIALAAVEYIENSSESSN